MIIANEDKLVEAVVRLFQGKIPLRLVTNAGGGNIGTFKRDWLKRTTKYEKDYLRIVLPIFKSIAEEVKKNVKKHSNNPKFWTFNVGERKRQLIISEAKMIAKVYPKEGQIGLDLVLEKPEEFAKDAFVGITFDVEDERAIKQALDRSNKLGSVAGNLHDDLHRKIANGIKEGLPMEDIAKSIIDYVEFRSVSTSLMVARTETIWASNAGAEMGYIQSGVVQGKQWLGGQAGICDICMDMDGMTAPLGGDFDVSAIIDKYGINFDYQEGHMPFPPLHPNCRCTIVPITKIGGAGTGKPSPLENTIQSGRITSRTNQGFQEGVNVTEKVAIDGNGSVAFKPVSGESQGLLQGVGGHGTLAERERAAYLINKEMGLSDVPITVLRSSGKKYGSAQYWIDDATVAKDIVYSDMSVYMRTNRYHQEAKMKVFDTLIANSDRHMGNYMIGKNKFVYIDNGYSLPNSISTYGDASYFKTNYLAQMSRKVRTDFVKSDVKEYITAIEKVIKSETLKTDMIGIHLKEEHGYLIQRAKLMVETLAKDLEYVGVVR